MSQNIYQQPMRTLPPQFRPQHITEIMNNPKPPLQRYHSPPSYVATNLNHQNTIISSKPSQMSYTPIKNINQNSNMKLVQVQNLSNRSNRSNSQHPTIKLPIQRNNSKSSFSNQYRQLPPNKIQVMQPVRRASQHRIQIQDGTVSNNSKISKNMSQTSSKRKSITINIETMVTPSRTGPNGPTIIPQTTHKITTNIPHNQQKQERKEELLRQQSQIKPKSVLRKIQQQCLDQQNRYQNQRVGRRLQKQSTTNSFIKNQKITINSRKLIDEIFQNQTNKALLRIKLMESRSLKKRKYY